MTGPQGSEVGQIVVILIASGSSDDVAVQCLVANTPAVLIAQGFDGVQARGFDGGQQPGDQANASSNAVEVITANVEIPQVDVARPIGLVEQRPQQRQASQHGRHRPARRHADDAAHRHNRHRLQQELRQDGALRRSDGFQHADLTRPLRHGDQHDVGQPHSADGQRQRADEAQQHAQRDPHGVHQAYVLVENKVCTARSSLGEKVVQAGQRFPHLPDRLLAKPGWPASRRCRRGISNRGTATPSQTG
jgi:hypothetical protein